MADMRSELLLNGRNWVLWGRGIGKLIEEGVQMKRMLQGQCGVFRGKIIM
jgi:hypothetical protein